MQPITIQWGSGTWYPLDVAAGDENKHIIAQALCHYSDLCIQLNVDQLDVGVLTPHTGLVVPGQVPTYLGPRLHGYGGRRLRLLVLMRLVQSICGLT